MPKAECWEISDTFWERVVPLIPAAQRKQDREYRRKPGGGRKPLDSRQVLAGILYVLRTGIQWNALPKERFGSPKAIHRYFQEWSQQGFFLALWRAGLAEDDEMEGIAWEWQSGDGAIMKAPLAQEAVDPNSRERGGERKLATPSAGERSWQPAVARRNRGQRS